MDRLSIQQIILLLLAAAGCLLAAGCASSTPATGDDETFFEPLQSIESPVPSRPAEPGRKSEQPDWIAKADSLQRILYEQAQRVDELTQQLQRLQASRTAARAESSLTAKKEPVRPASPALSTRREPTVTYEGALRVYESGRYQRAIGAFQEVLRGGIGQDLQDNCYFWIGVSQFNLKQFDRAAATFRRVIDWTGSDKKADAIFMLGQTHEQLGNSQQAKMMLEILLRDFPTSELIPAARQKLQRLSSAR